MSRLQKLKHTLDECVADVVSLRDRVSSVVDEFGLANPKSPEMVAVVEADAGDVLERRLSMDRMEQDAKLLAGQSVDVSTESAVVRAVAELWALNELKQIDDGPHATDDDHGRAVAKWDEFRSLLWSAVGGRGDDKATNFVVAWVPKDGRVWPAVFTVMPDSGSLPTVIPNRAGPVYWCVPRGGRRQNGWVLY